MDNWRWFCQKQCAAHQPMPDLIQFECPSCAATLRIPIEMSGHHGPCPVCHHGIVAPDPYSGIGAYLAVGTLAPSPEPPETAIAPEREPAAFADPLPEPVPFPAPLPEPEPIQESVPTPVIATVPVSTTDQPCPKDLIEPQPPDEPVATRAFAEDPSPPHKRDVQGPSSRRSRAGVLAFACAATASLALGAGLFIGNKMRPDPGAGPLVVHP